VIVSYGAQAVDEKVLKNVKRSPKEPAALASHLEICNKLGLFSVITYIFGLPGSTRENMALCRKFALDHKPTFVDYHPLGLLPGAELGATTELMVGAPGGDFTIEELEALCSEALREFYLRPVAIWRILKAVIKTNPAWLYQFPGYVIKEAVSVYSTRMLSGRQDTVLRPGERRWADGGREHETVIAVG
jgi:hypothetical protein